MYSNPETAINIGYSCQLLTDEMVDIFIVDGNSVEDVELQLLKCRESLRGYARTQIQTAITVMRFYSIHILFEIVYLTYWTKMYVINRFVTPQFSF